MALGADILKRIRGFRPAFPDWLYRLVVGCLIASVVVVPGAVWLGLRIPAIPFLNGMAIQGKAKAQSQSPEFADGVTTRRPPEGTVPRGFQGYPYANEPERAAAELSNPLPATMDNMRRGERQYDIFCQPCHGYKGLGDGSATGLGRLPAANSLVSEKVRAKTDGGVYHVIAEGQNTMPSYAGQIPPMDRWAIVTYVRALQRSQAPTAEDIGATTGTRERQGTDAAEEAGAAP
jgi:mono/diheme cytochrome c family protein